MGIQNVFTCDGCGAVRESEDSDTGCTFTWTPGNSDETHLVWACSAECARKCLEVLKATVVSPEEHRKILDSAGSAN